ncbi:phage antirepressor KilAC domain-containing protein, partial [Paenibacillus larvae]|uniref:phage antirepressor KilAC domain-containing protein n=1 Tax=Paenibacillus larvae TaxID=1464 RepID=UPI00228107BA
YTKSETIDIRRRSGDPYVTMNTRWTQKGRLFIHEILKRRGIVPVMDREKKGETA